MNEEEKIKKDVNIFDAIKDNKINQVKEYINNNGDVNIKDEDGFTLLHYATDYGHDTIVQCLITDGADIHIKDDGGYTPLHFAASNGYETIIQYLVANGADINSKNNDEFTPLHYIAKEGYASIVQYLIANGAAVSVQNRYGATPLHLAANYGHVNTIQHLIANDADPNIKNGSEMTPLHQATNAWSYTIETIPQYINIINLLLPLTNLTDLTDSYNLYISDFNTRVEGKQGVVSELIMDREFERFFTFCELFSIGTNYSVEEEDKSKQEKNSLMIGYDAPLEANEEEVRPFPPMFDSNSDESLFDVTLVGEIWDYARDFLRVEEINNYE